MKFLACLIFSLLVSHVLSHGWLNVPMPRGYQGDNQNSASQGGPCGPTGNGYAPTVQVQGNGSLSVEWQLGGGHDTGTGAKTCRFAWAGVNDGDNNANVFNSNVLYTVQNCVAGEQKDVVGLVDVPTGVIYLQFMWSAGDGSVWYNCVKLFVTDSGTVLEVLPVNTLRTLSIVPDTPIHFSIADIPKNDPNGPTQQMDKYYMYFNATISATTTGNLGNVTVSSQLIPYTYMDDTYTGLYVGQSSFVTVCDIGNGYAYATVFPGDLTGEVNVQATLYESHLDYVNNPRIATTLERGPLYVYWTQASSTFDKPKRIIVQGRGGKSFVSGPYRTCDYQGRNVGYIRPDEPKPCADVDQVNGNNVRTQYFYAEVDDTFIGNVRIEDGTCAEYSGVSQVIISFVLLIVALFF